MILPLHSEFLTETPTWSKAGQREKNRNVLAGTSHPRPESTPETGEPPEMEMAPVILSCRQKGYCGEWAVAEAPGAHSQQGRAPLTGLSRVFSEEIILRLPVTVLFPGQCRGVGGHLPKDSISRRDISDLLRPTSAAAETSSSQYPLCQRHRYSAPFSMVGESVLQAELGADSAPRRVPGPGSPLHRTCVPSSPAAAARGPETTI